MSDLVQCGDGVEGLLHLPGGAVDLLLSDLPSGDTAAAFDVEAELCKFWPAVWHALKPDGVAVVFASGIRFASKLISSEPKAFRYDMVWRKNYATGFLNAKKMPLRNHEYVLVFSRKLGCYVPQMEHGCVPITSGASTGGVNYGHTRPTRLRVGATDRYPKSVLDFPGVSMNSRDRIHPQQKPKDLLAYLVRTYSRPGDLVADPYAGSGSTGRAARSGGRLFIGWEIVPEIANAANAAQER